MDKRSYIFEDECHHCHRKFVSKIYGKVICPFCGKVTDHVVRVVLVIDEPKIGKVYIDEKTGKQLKIKTIPSIRS